MPRTTVMLTHRIASVRSRAVELATGADVAAMVIADQPMEVTHGLA